MRIKSNYLTIREKDTLDFIKLFIDNNGYPPTVREICAGLKLSSTGTVQQFLKGLLEKGYIKRGNGARTIQVVKEVI